MSDPITAAKKFDQDVFVEQLETSTFMTQRMACSAESGLLLVSLPFGGDGYMMLCCKSGIADIHVLW